MDQKARKLVINGDSACLYLLCLEMNVKRFFGPLAGVSFCQPAGLVNKAGCHMITQ